MEHSLSPNLQCNDHFSGCLLDNISILSKVLELCSAEHLTDLCFAHQTTLYKVIGFLLGLILGLFPLLS